MSNKPHSWELPGATTIHASAVCIGEEACIFLGPSGTGKSAICDLLSTHQHVQFLANEAIYLTAQADGRWYVSNADGHAYQGPLSKDQVASLPAAPLQAISRLLRASAPRLERIDALETCRYMTDGFFEIAWQREYDVATKRAIFSDIAEVCRSVPGYEFHFDLSPQTLEVFGLNEIDVR